MQAKYRKIDPVTIYPSNVICPPKEDISYNYHTTSKEIVEQFLAYTETDSRDISIERTVALTEIAVKLLAKKMTVQGFFEVQQYNGMLTERIREFIADTIRFINTGHRRVSIGTWINLLASDRDNEPHWECREGQEIKTHITGEDNQLEPGVNIIAQWIKQPEGFTDMLTTLYILFGDYLETKVI